MGLQVRKLINFFHLGLFNLFCFSLYVSKQVVSEISRLLRGREIWRWCLVRSCRKKRRELYFLDDQMRLTNFLLRYKKALPGGHLWRGKYRLYKKVTPKHLNDLRLAYEMEERNMFYLRHPYLTAEQSHGHAQALGKHEKFIAKKISEKEWRDNNYLGDRFGYLKIRDSWE